MWNTRWINLRRDFSRAFSIINDLWKVELWNSIFKNAIFLAVMRLVINLQRICNNDPWVFLRELMSHLTGIDVKLCSSNCEVANLRRKWLTVKIERCYWPGGVHLCSLYSEEIATKEREDLILNCVFSSHPFHVAPQNLSGMELTTITWEHICPICTWQAPKDNYKDTRSYSVSVMLIEESKTKRMGNILLYCIRITT